MIRDQSFDGSWIEIDGERLASNIQAFRGMIRPSTALMVVVKANAYGHGLDAVGRIVARHADWLGVNSIDEAIALDRMRLGRAIAVLGYTPPERAADAVRRGFHQVVYRLDLVRALSEAAREAGRRAPVHIKIETGTNRQGVPASDLASFARNIRSLGGLEVAGVHTHFANVEDTLDPSYALLQIRRFHEALVILANAGIRPPHVHATATAGVLLYPETHFTMVRVGIGAYGVWPSRETQIAARERARMIEIAPVLTWKSRIAQVKTVDTGEHVGYGLTFQARRPTRLVLVPVGYYDGYNRRLSGRGRALPARPARPGHRPCGHEHADPRRYRFGCFGG